MGDRAGSFDVFVAEHYEPVCCGLSVAFREPRLAEESTREAFARASARWARVGGTEQPDAWVYATAVRVARRRHRGLFDRAASAPATADPGTLPGAIERLPSRERTVLVLRYLGGLPLDRIAKAMGYPLATVKATLFAAHERLGVDVDDEIPEVDLDAP